MAWDKNWKRKRQVELQKKFICTALALILTGESFHPFTEKLFFNKKIYATYMTNKLRQKINNSSTLNDEEKDILYNYKLLYDVCSSYYDTYMEFEISRRFRKLDIKSFTEKDLQDETLENSIGYYTPGIPGTLHVRNYEEDQSNPYDFLKVISHEYVHLLQSASEYGYIKEAGAEIISSEYYNLEISSYTEECVRLKVLMEIIGSEPIWEAVTMANPGKLEKSIKELLLEESAQRFLNLLKKSPYESTEEERKNINIEIDNYLSDMYYNKYQRNFYGEMLIYCIYSYNDSNRLYFNTDRRTNPEKYQITVIPLETALTKGLVEELYYEIYKSETTNKEYKKYVDITEALTKMMDGTTIYFETNSLVDGIKVIYNSGLSVVLEEDTTKVTKEKNANTLKLKQ